MSGGNAIGVKRGIDKAVAEAIDKISAMAKPIESKEQITFVATISGNESEVGNIVGDAMEQVGRDGVITLEESRGRETSLSLVEGMSFDKGYISPFFVNNPERMECKHTDAKILLYDGKISDYTLILPLVTKVNDQLKKPLLIIAENVDGDALQFLVKNTYQHKFPWVAVKTPGFAAQKKDYLYDLAALTGATVVSNDMGISLENATIEHLGSCRTLIVNKELTTIIEGGGTIDALSARIMQAKATLAQVESDYEAKVITERVAKMSGGVAVIRIGASTEAEMIEKKYRYEDALAATRAAVEEGIVAGGGVTLLRISESLNTILEDADEATGYKIVKRSLQEPIRQIAYNAGLSPDVVVATVKKENDEIGLDARTGNYVNMIESGIIDPAKVARSALQNAASISGLVLTTEAMIVDKPISGERVIVSEGML
jgi:chaperonin GroEL